MVPFRHRSACYSRACRFGLVALPPTLELLENRDLPSFLNPVPNAVQAARPYAVAVGDFNNDGIPDTVTANEGTYPDLADSSASILLGNGDGTFQPPCLIPVTPGSGPFAVAVADFNGDGNLDFVLADLDHDTVNVVLGNGDGTFQAPVDYPGGGRSVAVGDVNNDGAPDIVTSGGAVLLNQGDGTFVPAPRLSGGDAVTLGDFNEDGNLDVVMTSATEFSYDFGTGDGTFRSVGRLPSGGTEALGAVAADFNGDGHLDLAFANYKSRNVTVLLGTGHGGFGLPNTLGNLGAGDGLAVADFNQDGIPDLAASSDDGLTYYLGKGDGSFTPGVEIYFGGFAYGVATGDLNGDGYPDAVVTDWYSTNAWVVVNAADWDAGGAPSAAGTFAGTADWAGVLPEGVIGRGREPQPSAGIAVSWRPAALRNPWDMVPTGPGNTNGAPPGSEGASGVPLGAWLGQDSEISPSWVDGKFWLGDRG